MFDDVVNEEALTALERRRARAEAETYTAMLAFAERRAVECGHADTSIAVLVQRSMIAMEIGQAMGLSEGQVKSRVACAARVRDHASATWASFQLGHIDAARLREISSAIDKLSQPESIALLDSRVVAYACAHTVAELRAVAAAIERRLHAESRQLPDDGRTLRQKEADLLTVWATSNEAGDSAVHADIAVTVPADVLSGAQAGFAESPDGSWVAPSGRIADLARSGNPFWHRIIVDPVSDDVLTHEYCLTPTRSAAPRPEGSWPLTPAPAQATLGAAQ